MKSKLLMDKSALSNYHQSNESVPSHYPLMNLGSEINEYI